MNTPNFLFEEKYWKEGFELVIGVDEVGRGPLAGPVVAGAALLRIKNKELRIQNKNNNIPNSYFLLLDSINKLGINDSKKLTVKKREHLSKEIPEYFHIGIGKSSVLDINILGVVRATEKAMERAFLNLFARNPNFQVPISKQIPKSIDQFFYQNVFVLVDGFRLKNFIYKDSINQEAIIKGDEKSISIAAASIMAKVYRDRLMVKLGCKFHHYGWEKNKGYGTKKHIEAIKKYGITCQHRKLFVRNLI